MDELISRSTLCEVFLNRISNQHPELVDVINAFVLLVYELPIAYDVDAVIKQIEQLDIADKEPVISIIRAGGRDGSGYPVMGGLYLN